jgi:ribonuclease E
MTRKRISEGLVEAFSNVCETCHGRGYLVDISLEGDID